MKIKSNGQSLLEYSVLLAVAISGLLVTQMYLKRGIQGRMRQAGQNISVSEYSPGNTISSSIKEIVSRSGGETEGALNSARTEERITIIGKETVTRR